MLTQFCGGSLFSETLGLGVRTGRAESVMEEKLLSGEARASERGTPARRTFICPPSFAK